MSVSTPNFVAYGQNNGPLIQVNPFPIVAQRAPLTTDKAPLGTLWVYPASNSAWVLTSIVANSASWENIGGGAGVFTSLTVTPGPINLTGTTNINITGAATTTIGTGGTGAVDIGNTTGGTIFTGNVGLNNNLVLANTNTAGTAGEIQFNAVRWISNYGTGNVFVGPDSGNTSLTTGTAVNNVAIGLNSGVALTTGAQNVFVGQGAGQSALSATANTGIGRQALSDILSGSSCVAVGGSALTNVTTGDDLIAIGTAAGTAYTTESSNIVIGHAGVAADANTLRIGSQGAGLGQIDLAFIAGIFGVTVGGSGVAVFIDNTGNLGTVVSSERFKEDIEDMDDYSSPIFDLRPVTFNYKKNGQFSCGLIAEEVEEVMEDLVVKDENGLPFTVKYQDLPVMILNELQKLNARVEALEAKRKGK